MTDQRQVRALLDQHHVMLQAYARHLLVSAQDADDVVQDLCLEVLANPGVLLRGDNPGAYLRGILRHLSGRHHRRYRRHQGIEELVEMTWDADEPVDTSLETRALRACLDQLGERIRRVLSLRYEEGCNASEIATRVSMQADAVRMALSRGRQTLARCLERRLGEALS